MEETNTSDMLHYAISNDRIEKVRLNSVVVFAKDENNRAYIAPSFNDYPSLDSVNTNQERETIAKVAFKAEGLEENKDFKFISMAEMNKMVEKHNTLENDYYGQSDFLGNHAGRPISSQVCHNQRPSTIKDQIIDMYSPDDLDNFTSELIKWIDEKPVLTMKNQICY